MPVSTTKLDEALNIPWTEVKARSKAHAVKAIGYERWHDAGFDALASIRAWEFLQSWIAISSNGNRDFK